MKYLALIAAALATPAHADVLICDFTPQACPMGVSCAPFSVIIDTHHATDAPFFSYNGHTAPITVVPDDLADGAQSYVTLGHSDREIITLFQGFDAIHTRHFMMEDQPVAVSATGTCIPFS